MRKLEIAAVCVALASPAFAQSTQSLSAMAPVLGDVGLAVLAIGMGLGGAWGISKYRGK